MIFHDPAVLSAKPGRIFVQPGFNAAIPFDQITIENTAQAGKDILVPAWRHAPIFVANQTGISLLLVSLR